MMFGLGQALCIFMANATCRCSMGRVLDQRDNDPLGLPIPFGITDGVSAQVIGFGFSLCLEPTCAWQRFHTREEDFLIIFPRMPHFKVHHAILPGA